MTKFDYKLKKCKYKHRILIQKLYLPEPKFPVHIDHIQTGALKVSRFENEVENDKLQLHPVKPNVSDNVLYTV